MAPLPAVLFTAEAVWMLGWSEISLRHLLHSCFAQLFDLVNEILDLGISDKPSQVKAQVLPR